MDFQANLLTCSICQDVYKEPVLLSCSHSFCKDCLRIRWRQKLTQECPVCKRRSSRSDPPQNLALRNLCEDYVQQREQKAPEEMMSREMCQVTSERLKLFCLTDQQPVCVVCRESRVHEDHCFRPIAEAAEDLRDELDKFLPPLKEDLQNAMKHKRKIRKKTYNIQKQFYQTERQIQAEFKKLHQCLVEEEASRIKALRKEEEQKSQKMKDTKVAMSREIEALSESIRVTEEQLRAPDVSLLLKHNAAMERVQDCPLLEEEPQLGPGALIDQAKHLGNLTFNIWTNMKKVVHYPPVILDPNWAIYVVLSDDLTSFTFDDQDTEQESDEYDFGTVYSSERFGSGSHIWDVEVGDNDDWALGVTADMFDGTYNDEDWAIVFFDGKYIAKAFYEDDISLKLVPNPKKIRIFLDCDKHEVSFYDLDINAHIHTFTHISHKKLIPFFSIGGKSPIRILPQIFDSSSPFKKS